MQGPVAACMAWKPSEKIKSPKFVSSTYLVCMFISARPVTITMCIHPLVADALPGWIHSGMWLEVRISVKSWRSTHPASSVSDHGANNTPGSRNLPRLKPSVFIQAVDAPRGRTTRHGATYIIAKKKKPEEISKSIINLVICLSQREDGTEVTSAVSNRNWKHRMGVERDHVYRRHLDYCANLQSLLSPKTGRVGTFLVYVRAALDSMGRRLAVATSKRVRAIRSRQYGRRQRVLGDIVDRILRHKLESDSRGVVVAYGAASFSCKERSIPQPGESTAA